MIRQTMRWKLRSRGTVQITMDTGTMDIMFAWDLLFRKHQYMTASKIHDNQARELKLHINKNLNSLSTRDFCFYSHLWNATK